MYVIYVYIAMYIISKFNEYLYVKTFVVESDHKPLKSILNTPINKTCFYKKYHFAVNYVHGKDVICSETLSRAPLKEQTPEISETELNYQVHSVISTFPISTERLKQVETLNDKTLQRVASYIAQGWLNL